MYDVNCSLGITKTGLGRIVEGFHRTVPFDAILGGSEFDSIYCLYRFFLTDWTLASQ